MSSYMNNKIRNQPWYLALLVAGLLSLLGAGIATGTGNIDMLGKWAWSPAAGWISFGPEYGGVVVYPDHLEGYAWGETIGWIRLGTHTGGGSHTYTNSSADDYGVNRTGGTLAGFAWGENIGWINFAPPNGGVTIDSTTGEFAGFAWAENIGWIKVRGGIGSALYGVNLSGYTVNGQVLGGSGAPLAGVTLSDGTHTTMTDVSGSYTLTGVIAGVRTIMPRLGGYTFTPATRPITVTTGNISGQNFTGALLTYTISGQVRDGSGNPLAGVTLSDGAHSAISDAGGGYTIADLLPGAYTISPSKSGYTFAPADINVAVSNANVGGQNFTGTRIPSTYTISGRMLDSTGAGLAGVAVSDGTRSTLSDASGNYSISGVPAGSYTLTPNKSGYTFTPATIAVTVSDANLAGQNFAGTVIPNTYTVSGQIRDGGGNPIAGVILTDGTRSAFSDASGSYTIAGVPAGSYTLTPARQGYTFFPATRSVTVTTGNLTGEGFLAIALPSTFTIAGQVLDSRGNPLAGVVISDGSRTTISGANGAYQLTGAPPATYTVTPSKRGYRFDPPSRSVVLSTENAAGQNFSAAAEPLAAGALAGVVFEDRNFNGRQEAGEPGIASVPITRLQHDSEQARTTTDGSGVYSFAGLVPGSHTVRITLPSGYAATGASEQTVNIVSGAATAASFGVQAQGMIAGAIFEDRNGNGRQESDETGIGGVMVSLTGNGAPVQGTSTGSDGLYSFANTAPGAYRVSIEPPAGSVAAAFNQSQVTLPPGGAAGASFGIQMQGSIGGALYQDRNGNGQIDSGDPGIDGILVNLTDASGQISATTTNAAGAYQFTGLIPGIYRVQPAVPGAWRAQSAIDRAVILGSGGAAAANFGYLPGGTIAGVTFQDRDGDGVQRFDEPGVGDAALYVLQNGVLLTTTVTGSDGAYQVTGLAAGNYLLIAVLPEGFAAVNGTERHVPLADQGTASGSFGVQPVDFISGVLFDDLNGDGVRQSVDPGIAGATVTLLAAGADGRFQTSDDESVASMVSDAAGVYRFVDAPANAYLVRLAVPAGYAATSPSEVIINLGQRSTAVANFGAQAVGRVAVTTFEDRNDNGRQDAGETPLAGLPVVLEAADAANPLASFTATTSSAGLAIFSDLPAGDYTIRTEVPAGGYVARFTQALVTVAPERASSRQFGFRQTGTVTGRLYLELNGNEREDLREPGLSGVVVTLLDAEGVAQETRVTAGDGSYSFSEVPGGAFQLQVPPPLGYVSTSTVPVPIVLAGEGADAAVTVSVGFASTGNVTGVVFADLNKNGVQDGGEPGVGDTVVTLRGVYSPERSVQSTANGALMTPEVQNDVYDVEVTLPPHFVAITAPSVSVAVDGYQAPLVRFGLYPSLPNHAPKMAAIPDYTFEAGETVAIQVSATDADDSLLGYAVTGAPRGVSIDPSSGLITGRIAPDDQGVYPVTVTVTDPLGATDERTFTLTVTPWSTSQDSFLYLPIISGGKYTLWFPILIQP